jgi:2-polyprenyl-6-methoxyphenol hydroxylase-like FAD-dependent oxidoreductase
MPPGRGVLRELGLEEQALRAGGQPLRGIRLRLTDGEPVELSFPPHQGLQEGMGVRRLAFDKLLLDAATREPSVTFLSSTEVIRVLPGKRPRLLTKSDEFSSRFVAVADGLRSRIRHQLGWTVGPRAPHRYGVIGHFRVGRPQPGRIDISVHSGFERYEAPVGQDERLVALLLHKRHMDSFAGNLERGYEKLVGELNGDLRPSDRTTPVQAIGPFRFSAGTVARDRVFLVGDAAGFVDPISAEGLAAALTQAKALVASLQGTSPEATYRRAHRQLTRDPRRISRLFVHLAADPRRTARGLRGLRHAPQLMPKMLGINFGYWGFERITPREWLALLTGH